ncbi:hypothetical protein AB4Z40_34895 [Bosea sp. 2YAB26]|uniref:hypothetical protein n=1 Tax=Bosea sp. 2YAB26 TaxID=3237478 RepID=UPI003F90C264
MLSTLFFGIPGFYRVADGLDCGAEIKIVTHAKGTNCEGCERRVVRQKDKNLRFFERPKRSQKWRVVRS